MFRLAIFSGVLVLSSLFYAKKLTVRKSHDPGNCSEPNHGEIILVKDRENKDTILVCTEDNGNYAWKTTDNSKPTGEYFDPGYDCLDILNKNTKAKDGYYWVDFHRGKPIKVYCDMSTDGGGYILIGRMNNTVTWHVPSSNTTVEPFGPSQWSSEFGDVSVLDFRIQVASDDDFESTKAHWSFRFKNKRLLKNLMIVDQAGCPSDFPGIGNVSYVKDLITEEIVARDFSCSIFGQYSHPIAKIGWTMMNLCLEKRCRKGFAYHPLYPIQVDFSGGFSHVIPTNNSDSKSGTTAFFGCEKGKCCACYGPPGGKDVYCLKECQPVNGGTVTKHASAWFWVRLNPPRKVWEKCMEYQSEDENGDSAWYKLVGDRNIPIKGRCGNSEPLLNDGTQSKNRFETADLGSNDEKTDEKRFSSHGELGLDTCQTGYIKSKYCHHVASRDCFKNGQSVYVAFSQPFKTPPKVMIGLTLIDSYSHTNVRVRATVNTIIKEGFYVKFQPWDDSFTYQIGVNWMACP